MAWNEGYDMDATERSLIAGVLSDPHADAPRLVYADYLDEQHDAGPRTLPCPHCGDHVWSGCQTCGGEGAVPDKARPERAELIRLQCGLRAMPEEVEVVGRVSMVDWANAAEADRIGHVEWNADETEGTWFRTVPNPDRKAAVDRIAEIVRHAREREWLLPPGCVTEAAHAMPPQDVRSHDQIDFQAGGMYSAHNQTWYSRVRCTIDRGFVGRIVGRSDWLLPNWPSVLWSPPGHGNRAVLFPADMPVGAQPVTEFYFTDLTKEQVEDMAQGMNSMWPWLRVGWFNPHALPTGQFGLVAAPGRKTFAAEAPTDAWGDAVVSRVERPGRAKPRRRKK